jgi:hypothetical protein
MVLPARLRAGGALEQGSEAQEAAVQEAATFEAAAQEAAETAALEQAEEDGEVPVQVVYDLAPEEEEEAAGSSGGSSALRAPQHLRVREDALRERQRQAASIRAAPRPEPSNPYGEAWQEFEQDTAAGRLLRRVYARPHNRPLESYPAVRVRASEGDKPTWCNLKPAALDPRQDGTCKARQQRVAVPNPLPAPEARAPAILGVARRKPAQAIAQEAEREAADQPAARPLPRKAVSTDFEKRRLAVINQFKGGKALPAAGLAEPLAGQIPLSLLTGKPGREAYRAAAERGAARQRAEEERLALEQHQLAQDFDDAHAEVRNLKQLLDLAEPSHAASRRVAELKHQLQRKVCELRNIDELITHIKGVSL